METTLPCMRILFLYICLFERSGQEVCAVCSDYLALLLDNAVYWYSTYFSPFWKQVRNMELFTMMQKQMRDLMDWRRQILSGTLPGVCSNHYHDCYVVVQLSFDGN